MHAALPDAMVTGQLGLIPQLNLPDPDDRHVLAAAISSNAETIITLNLKDFPDENLTPYGIRSKHPDTFLSEIYDTVPEAAIASTANARRNLSRTLPTIERYLLELTEAGLPGFGSVMFLFGGDAW